MSARRKKGKAAAKPARAKKPAARKAVRSQPRKAKLVKQAIRTDGAPTPTGPFNQAIKVGNLVFTSGQAGRNRETGLMGDIHDQARRCIGNIAAILKAAGSSLDDIVKATVYLRDPADWKGFNEEYVKLMPLPLPARTSAIVELKNPDMKVEMEVIAVIRD